MTTAALYLLKCGDYIPQFDVERAVRSIVKADSFTALEIAWYSIAMDYEMSERVIEPEIRELYEWQKEMLTDVAQMIARGAA